MICCQQIKSYEPLKQKPLAARNHCNISFFNIYLFFFTFFVFAAQNVNIKRQEMSERILKIYVPACSVVVRLHSRAARFWQLEKQRNSKKEQKQ